MSTSCVILVVVEVVPVQVVEGELAEALLGGPAVEQELGVHAPVGGGHHGGAVGERADERQDPLPVLGPVELVDDHQVGEGEVPVDLGMPLPGLQELGRVHDFDEPAVHHPAVLAGEHHPHELLRLGEPAGLDDDDVDPGCGSGQPFQVLVQFGDVDGTAQTSVAERHGGVAERAGDGHGVDLDRPEVIDDGADAAATTAMEEVVEQCGLPGAEESGENDDGDLRRTLRAVPFVQAVQALQVVRATRTVRAHTFLRCRARHESRFASWHRLKPGCRLRLGCRLGPEP
jgi:hypothetical protein